MIHPWVTENGNRPMQRVTNIIERGDISEEEVIYALKPTPSLRLSVRNFRSNPGQSPSIFQGNAIFQSPTKAPMNKPPPLLLQLDENIEIRQVDLTDSSKSKLMERLVDDQTNAHDDEKKKRSCCNLL